MNKPTEEQKKCAQAVFDKLLETDFVGAEESMSDMMSNFQKEYKQCFINKEQDIAGQEQDTEKPVQQEDSTAVNN